MRTAAGTAGEARVWERVVLRPKASGKFVSEACVCIYFYVDFFVYIYICILTYM